VLDRFAAHEIQHVDVGQVVDVDDVLEIMSYVRGMIAISSWSALIVVRNSRTRPAPTVGMAMYKTSMPSRSTTRLTSARVPRHAVTCLDVVEETHHGATGGRDAGGEAATGRSGPTMRMRRFMAARVVSRCRP